jgi:hypothetical protein
MIGACSNHDTTADWLVLRLTTCDWPVPNDLQLKVDELNGHTFQILYENFSYRSVTFLPSDASQQDRATQDAPDHVLEPREVSGDATIYEFRMTHPGLSLPDEQATEKIFVVEVADMRVNVVGFSIADTRSMVRHCQFTRR